MKSVRSIITGKSGLVQANLNFLLQSSSGIGGFAVSKIFVFSPLSFASTVHSDIASAASELVGKTRNPNSPHLKLSMVSQQPIVLLGIRQITITYRAPIGMTTETMNYYPAGVEGVRCTGRRCVPSATISWNPKSPRSLIISITDLSPQPKSDRVYNLELENGIKLE